MTPPPIRIRIPKTTVYTYYIYRTSSGRWQLSNNSGVPLALSNICRDEMLLRFALEDAGDDAQKALDAVKTHVHSQYGKVAELVAS